MIRWGIAAGMGFGPIVLIATLLALGQQSYELCFNGVEPSFLSAFASQAAVLFHPIGFVGVVPFLALASIWVSRTSRPLTVVLWLALLALAGAMLWPPSGQHDCDRKGMDGAVSLILLVFPGIFASWIAIWKSQPLEVEP